MADIPPTNPPTPGAPGSPVTPPKRDTGKVQPKKDTVSISLPPIGAAAQSAAPAAPAGPPLGAVPPPKKETGKVQPKKETVRINLPPKPSAAPTIKLPTLPPGGPTGAPSAAPPPAAAPRTAAAPVAAPAAPRTGTAAPARPDKTCSTPRRARCPPPLRRPSALFDKILAIAAMIAALAAVGCGRLFDLVNARRHLSRFGFSRKFTFDFLFMASPLIVTFTQENFAQQACSRPRPCWWISGPNGAARAR